MRTRIILYCSALLAGVEHYASAASGDEATPCYEEILSACEYRNAPTMEECISFLKTRNSKIINDSYFREKITEMTFTPATNEKEVRFRKVAKCAFDQATLEQRQQEPQQRAQQQTQVQYAQQQQQQQQQQHSNGQSAQARQYRSGQGCVHYDNSSNSLSDFFVNNCSFRVWVGFVNQNGNGAAGPIAPGRREAVSKGRGNVHWAACEDPGRPYLGTSTNSPKWNGSGNFACISR